MVSESDDRNQTLAGIHLTVRWCQATQCLVKWVWWAIYLHVQYLVLGALSLDAWDFDVKFNLTTHKTVKEKQQ